jgi:hypothetical protein
VAVSKTTEKQIKEIEDTQEALRESIEQAKDLADKAQELLQKHKKTVEGQSGYVPPHFLESGTGRSLPIAEMMNERQAC